MLVRLCFPGCDDSNQTQGDGGMSELGRGELLQIMLTKEEAAALDDWRFAKRMPSRAAAVRELLKRGLAAEGFDQARGGSRSEDFGVTGKSSASPSRNRSDGNGQDTAE